MILHQSKLNSTRYEFFSRIKWKIEKNPKQWKHLKITDLKILLQLNELYTCTITVSVDRKMRQILDDKWILMTIRSVAMEHLVNFPPFQKYLAVVSFVVKKNSPFLLDPEWLTGEWNVIWLGAQSFCYYLARYGKQAFQSSSIWQEVQLCLWWLICWKTAQSKNKPPLIHQNVSKHTHLWRNHFYIGKTVHLFYDFFSGYFK